MRTLMIQKIKGLCTLVYNPRSAGAPGKNRTCGTWIRNPLLYPLSYGGWRSPCGDACPIGCIYILETCNGVKIIFEACLISAPNYPVMLKYIKIS